MIKGFIIGKFYPLHLGHIGLIDFAEKQCDELIVLICASDKETIEGPIRLQWLQQTFRNHSKVKPVLFNYLEQVLPNTSVSSKEVSRVWASQIKARFDDIDIIFSSEKYGDYLAEFLECKHIPYEPTRVTNNISADEIRQHVFKHWNYLADAAKPFFVKKVCLYGTESTGKSILTEKLAIHYETEFVPEMARDIINTTEECTEQHLIQIAELHAQTIIRKTKTANKLLFVDTDLNITRSYSKYLFGKELVVDKWVEEANQFDLHLYLDNSVQHIQDGTRLNISKRNELNKFHRAELEKRGIAFEVITGDWDARFKQCINIIEHRCR